MIHCKSSVPSILVVVDLVIEALTSFTVSIDNHNMTVIEADGIETNPVVVDSLAIYAAQRYSVIVHANQPIGNYCM